MHRGGIIQACNAFRPGEIGLPLEARVTLRIALYRAEKVTPPRVCHNFVYRELAPGEHLEYPYLPIYSVSA